MLLSQVYISVVAVLGGLWCLLGLAGALDEAYHHPQDLDRARFCLAVCLMLAGISFAIGTVELVWA